MQLVALRDWYPQMADKWAARLADLRRQGVKTVYSPGEREAWIVHHTVGGANMDPIRYARIVADGHWEKWRRPGGYNFLTVTDGRVLEMCGWEHVGAHSGTHYWNRHGWGNAFQGDYRTIEPADVMLNAAAELMAVHPREQKTHRAVRPEPTSCPGNALIRLLPLEDDMPLTDDDLEKVRQIIWFNADMIDYKTGEKLHASTLVRHARNDAYQARVDAAVARKLIEAGALSSTPMTQSQIEAIAEEVADELRARLAE